MQSADERRLVERLRGGDETAFRALIEAHSSALLRLARVYVGSGAVAEEVVQETWLGVLRGLDRFEGRSSLKTWVYRILTNIATTRAARERRSLPFSSLAEREAGADAPVVDVDRFLPPDHDRWPHHWALGPTRWETPEEGLLAGEARELILAEVERLPAAQRTVITLRDLEGWPANDVCETLELSEVHQRVLLHRARSRVRRALESYFDAVELTVA